MSEPVRILRIAAGGDGVGKLIDGRTVFVPRTAPGDLVGLTEVRPSKSFARARMGSLIESGTGRTTPRCRHYETDDCGGCQLQHLDSPSQREARRGAVGDALRRIGHQAVVDPELEASPDEWTYRTKITLAVRPDGRAIGLHPVNQPKRVFDLAQCEILVAPLQRLWAAMRDQRALFAPGLEQVVLRLDREGGCHVLFRTRAEEVWNGVARLDQALRNAGTPAVIWWEPPGGAARALAGAKEPYPATVFEQIHPVMGDRARAFALGLLQPVRGRHVWDLYAGIGESTQWLVDEGASVESVEVDPRAVSVAERRGPGAGVTRHAARVEDAISTLHAPALVLANPPRAGMAPGVVERLARSGAERIGYISCDPATLARDIARLAPYRLTTVRAFDLFPQTAHVETVALLEPA